MSIRHGGEPCIHRSRTLAMKPSRFSVISRMTPTGVNAVELRRRTSPRQGRGRLKARLRLECRGPEAMDGRGVSLPCALDSGTNSQGANLDVLSTVRRTSPREGASNPCRNDALT
jgi:hypothetical protein